MYRAVLLEIGKRLEDAAEEAATLSIEDVVKHLTLDELREAVRWCDENTNAAFPPPHLEEAWERAMQAAEAARKGGCANV